MTERAGTYRASADHNPFSTRYIRPGAVPFLFLNGETCRDLIEQLRAFDWRAEIVGPHGSGKSTLLQSLVPQLERAGKTLHYFELHDGQSRLPFDRTLTTKAGSRSIVIIDGFEQLGWSARRRVKSWCERDDTGLLVTSHKSTGLPTLCQTSVSIETAKAVVDQIVPVSKSHGISSADVGSLLELHGGNMREVLFGLYDLYEQRRRTND